MTHPMLHIQSFVSNSRAWLLSLNCKHAISKSYTLSCQVLTDVRVDVEKVLGQPQSISFNLGKSQRYFHGLVSSIEQQDSPSRPLFCYNLMIRPDLYFLHYHTDCCIFQGKTVLDITRYWFEYFGIANVDYSGLRTSYEKLNYCVMFNESVYDFLLRLWAQVGIFFWFEFEEGKHILKLADGIHAYHHPKQSFPLGPCQHYHFSRWEQTLNPNPRNLTLVDYDYQQAEHRLKYNMYSNGSHSSHAQPYVMYPGGFRSFSQAESIGIVENQRMLGGQEVVTARSNIPNLVLGDVVSLKGDSDNSFVVTSIEHRISDDSHLPSTGKLQKSSYSNILQAIPSGTVCRPPARSKPMFSGVHTAVVTGPSGSDIYTDDLCRIKVKFHWDRHGKADQHSSCWIRTAQGWAGKHYGMQFVPRVGQEVLVRYLHGDLDCPVVIGAVYNAINKPPYDLPRQAAISCIKTVSATSVHANELLFDDTPGTQRLLLHAAHDFQQNVLSSHNTTVENDVDINVGNMMQVAVKQGEYHIRANSIELSAGNSTITLSGQGIQIQADKVTFNS